MNKKLIGIAFALLFGIAPFLVADAAASQNLPNRNIGMIHQEDRIANVDASTGDAVSARTVVVSVVNFTLFFLGILTTAMIIYGGFLYITAAGDEGGTEKGKKVLLYSAIGIVLIFVAFALTNTLLGVANPDSDGNPTDISLTTELE